MGSVFKAEVFSDFWFSDAYLVSQLAAWPEVIRTVGLYFKHVNTAGYCCHGPDAVGVSSKHQRAPHLSLQSRGWVRTLLSAGIMEIMRKHLVQKQFAEDECDGKLTRDSFLKRQDVCSLEHKLAETVWKWHEDEATSVQLFKDRHAKNVNAKNESTESSDQRSRPLTASQPSQATQPFVVGLVTDDMRAAALKYGHNNVVFSDATSATNHLKFTLYAALVVDDHGNGLPNFEVLSESTAQPAVTDWMVPYKQYIQTFQAAWRPLCHMADDAKAETNAIR